VPFGGFEPLRSPAQRRRDAKLAAESEREKRAGQTTGESGAGDGEGSEDTNQ
jgi:hypothetical protein